MNLGRFKEFAKQVATERTAIGGKVIQITRRWQKKWFAENETELQDSHLIRSLEATLVSPTPWRAKSSPLVYFPISELDVVVLVTFAAPPRQPKINETAAKLKQTLGRALAAYMSTHDPLTSLWNKEAFDRLLVEASFSLLDKIAHQSPNSTSAPSESMSAVTLYMLDLDHFKQINDTHGHSYGDAVLQSFAKRLEVKCSKLFRNESHTYSVDIGRLGGEEFGILVSGISSKEHEMIIAEDIRKTIVADPLPNDVEWETAKLIVDSGFELPPPYQRMVSASIGISNLRSLSKQPPAEAAARRLLHEADTAAYRAKAGGRNTIRHFNDILQRHGRVLEHHEDTAVITIDIGSNVGVKEGSEFLVFHPDFDGNRQFVYSDGRTQRPLGYYPRMSSGRLVVFKVQNEISFARIEGDNPPKPFRVGSRLEAIPLGSIAHLLGGAIENAQIEGIESISSFEKKVKQLADGKKNPFCAVCTIRDVESIADERGSAAVNRALAHLYRALRTSLSSNTSFCQSADTSISFICAKSDLPSKFELKTVLSRAEASFPFSLKYLAGVFSEESVAGQDGDKSKFDPQHALAYARYAAVGLSEEVVRVFGPLTASEVLFAARQDDDYQRCKKDFIEFKRLGIENGYAYAQMALCSLLTNNEIAEVGLPSGQRAVELEPTVFPIRANLGLILLRQNLPIAAAKEFLLIDSQFDDSDPVRPYLIGRAVSYHQTWKANEKFITKEMAISALKRALEKGNSDAGIYASALQAAIQDLGTGQTSSALNGQ